MRTITLAIVGGLMAATASAQTTAPTGSSAPAVTTTPGTPLSSTTGVNANTGTVPGAGAVDRNSGTAAAAGDRNQAVTTTAANAPQPAKGANSFTAGEAQRRIESEGFSTVSNLKKDDDGIWRGNAMKNGTNMGVWLDYKGNIGQQ